MFFLTFEGELFEISKGNVGYPWQGTLAVVPHIALYNHYIIHVQTPRKTRDFCWKKYHWKFRRLGLVHVLKFFWPMGFKHHFFLKDWFLYLLVNDHIAGWNIPMFNRKYIFIPGPFFIAMLVYRSVSVIFVSAGHKMQTLCCCPY